MNLIRVYQSFVVFAQHFPKELTGLQVWLFIVFLFVSEVIQTVASPTPCGYTTREFADRDCVGVTKSVSGFPVLEISGAEKRNFLNFRGYDLIQTGIGRWSKHDYDGSTIGSPLILFNKNLDTLIVSALNHPMIAVQQLDNRTTLSCGPNAKIDRIPQNFTFETLVVVGSGVNATMTLFGDIMLRQGGKQRPDLFAASAKLSYSTG